MNLLVFALIYLYHVSYRLVTGVHYGSRSTTFSSGFIKKALFDTKLVTGKHSGTICVNGTMVARKRSGFSGHNW